MPAEPARRPATGEPAMIECPVREVMRWDSVSADLVDEDLEVRHVLLGEVGEWRTHGTGRAADRREAALDDAHRVPPLAVADVEVGQYEVVELSVDRLEVLAAHVLVEA